MKSNASPRQFMDSCCWTMVLATRSDSTFTLISVTITDAFNFCWFFVLKYCFFYFFNKKPNQPNTSYLTIFKTTLCVYVHVSLSSPILTGKPVSWQHSSKKFIQFWIYFPLNFDLGISNSSNNNLVKFEFFFSIYFNEVFYSITQIERFYEGIQLESWECETFH